MKVHYSDIWREVARQHPHRLAVIGEHARLDYAEFAARAGGIAAHLTREGLRPGDAVAIFSHNRVEYLEVLFACLATGIAPVPVNYRYRAREVGALLRDSEARALVAPGQLAATALSAAATCQQSLHLMWLDDPDLPAGVDAGSGATLVADIPPDSDGFGDPPPDGELRLYTGGTTGQPKAVVWTAADILDVQLVPTYGAIGLELPRTKDEALRIATDANTPRLVTLPVAPFMHGTALFNAMNTLALGGTVVVDEHPHLDGSRVWNLVREHAVTRLIIAGDAVGMPLAESAPPAGERTSLTSIISSGMRLSDETARALHAVGDLTISDILAATEGGPFAMRVTTRADEVPGDLRLLPGAILLDGETEVQDVVGARGVLAFRGPLPRGYWGDPERTARTFPEIRGRRHVIPGDWALALGDGRIELLGRGSAVVNTGGEKVYPAEVEAALLSFPGIRDAVVFGLPDSRFGQVVTAMVATDEARPLEQEALRTHLDSQLAGYKKPRHVVVRATLGRTAHGKLDMATVLEEARAELGM